MLEPHATSPESTPRRSSNLPGPAPANLRESWASRHHSSQGGAPGFYERFCRAALSAGEFLLVIEAAREGLESGGESLGLSQHLALALAQSGAPEAAEEILRNLQRHGHQDETTLGLLGRVYKGLWRQSTDGHAKDRFLELALEAYTDAFARHGTYYAGINVAFVQLMSGQAAASEATARRVIALCQAQLSASPFEVSPWLSATLGEAHLYLGQLEGARACYQRAAASPQLGLRELSTMRQQARLVLQVRQTEATLLDRCFALPTLVIFTGHMLDSPTRPQPRFPADLAPAVQDEIRARLGEMQAGIGYAAAASGADLLFCECLLERQGELHLVLPEPVEAFVAHSVAYAGPDWHRRFERVREQARSLACLSPSELPPPQPGMGNPVGYVYANRVMTGLGLLHARALDLACLTLAVWNEEKDDGLGGTNSLVAEWEQLQLKPQVISLRRLRPELGLAPVHAGASPAPSPAAPRGINIQAMPQDIKAILFADVVNFGRLGEAQVRSFVTGFLDRVAQILFHSTGPPVVNNTWGDALFLVFDGLKEAGLCALGLRDMVAATSWPALGLPADLGLRISVHAGPVFIFWDPTTRQISFTGSHVTRAARVEPITARGQVYVTQEFAALCAAEGLTDFTFEYLGHKTLEKQGPDIPVYRLDRAAGAG